MILFIFEGKDDEPRLFKTLKELFSFEFKEEEILHYYCNNIFSLYDTLKSYSEEQLDDSVDVINVLKEEAARHNKKSPDLDKIRYSSDVSEIFLFFDYDIKRIDDKNKLTIEEQNKKILELFNYFDSSNSNSARNGVNLYINYPMLESYKYFRLPLPDENYKHYSVDALIDGDFKRLAADFCGYKNLKYLCYDLDRKGNVKIPRNAEQRQMIRQNWLWIKDMNIKKANYICSDSYSIPDNKESISQRQVLKNQIEKYVNAKHEVAILNSFPLFWLDYIDEDKLLT